MAGQEQRDLQPVHGHRGPTWSTWLPEIWDTFHEVPMLTCNTNRYTTAQVLAGSADSTTESLGTSPTGHRGAGRRQTGLHPPVLGGERRDQRQHAHGGDPVRRLPEKATWIANGFSYIKTTPVKMSLWFKSDYPQRDYSVFSDDQNGLDPYSAGGCRYVDTNITYNAYCDYKSGVDDPYFIGADPANSRLLTDTQFQGGF